MRFSRDQPLSPPPPGVPVPVPHSLPGALPPQSLRMRSLCRVVPPRALRWQQGLLLQARPPVSVRWHSEHVEHLPWKITWHIARTGEVKEVCCLHGPLTRKSTDGPCLSMGGGGGCPCGASGPGGGDLSISVDIFRHMNSVVLCGRSRGPCLARADGCVPLQGCCQLVDVLPTCCLRVAFFVTERYLWPSRPLSLRSHFFPCFCADRLLCAPVLAQTSSGKWGGGCRFWYHRKY